MQRSAEINELAKALVAAQAAIGHAHKASVNPHFKSRYADLASVWDACRKPLTDNGLCVVQLPHAAGTAVSVTTALIHTTGQFIEDTLTVTATQNTPQAIGSAVTYIRRYSLQSIAGIAPDDDDGNESSRPKETAAARPLAVPTVKVEPVKKDPGFDPKNKNHVEALRAELVKRKITDPNEQDEVVKVMPGKRLEDLTEVITSLIF